MMLREVGIILRDIAPALLPALLACASCSPPADEDFEDTVRDIAYRQANTLLSARQYGEAEAAFRRTLDLDSLYAPAWTDLANLHAQLGRLDEAAAEYARALAADSTYVRAHHNLAVVYADQFRFVEAIELLKIARDLQPDYAPALEAMALMYDRLGTADRVEESLVAVLAADSTRVKARTRLGRLYTRQGRYEEALELLLPATRLAPDDGAAWLHLGQLYLDWRRPQQALDAFTAAVAADSSHVEASYNLARAMMAVGRREEGRMAMARFTRQAEHAGVVEQLRTRLEAATVPTDEVETRLELAYRYRQMGAVNRTLTQLHAVLAAAPDNLVALVGLSSHYLRAGDRSRARALCETGIAAHPGDPETAKLHGIVGFIHLDEGEYDSARTALERAVELDAGLAKAWSHLGYVLVQTGEVDRAVDAYRRAVEAEPASAEAHFNLGKVRQMNADLDSARRHYIEAVAADSTYTRARLALGLLYEEIDSLAEAANSYRHFIRDWKGNEEGLRLARARLEGLGERR